VALGPALAGAGVQSPPQGLRPPGTFGSVLTLADRGGATVAYPPQEQSRHQTERILRSAAFRNAHTLQQLLQFLVAHAYGTEAESLKEYTIGVEAFGRPMDFDPKTDPIVRVQTHRLRQKLREYYDTDGRHDPILIEIPKGHYLPTIDMAATPNGIPGHLSAPPLDTSSSGDPAIPPEGSDASSAGQAPQRPRRFDWLPSIRSVVTAAAAAAIFAIGLWVGSHRLRSGPAGNASASSAADKPPDPVKTFWAGLLGNDTSPIIAHADAVFLLDARSDLFWFPHEAGDFRGAPVDPHFAQQYAAAPALVARAGKLYYETSYLGSGDLEAIATLANLFGEMGIRPVIEAGKDLTPDDLKQHDVILVGSSFQSFAVAQFNTMGDFSFKDPHSGQQDWSGVIVNAHPRPGEASVYGTVRDPQTGVLKTDHALITVEPSVVPGRYIVDLGGLDTTGCEGAAMFATSRTDLEELLKALAAQGIHGANGAPPLFQALLSVRLEKGYEVLGESLVTVHPLTSAHKGEPAPTGAPASTK